MEFGAPPPNALPVDYEKYFFVVFLFSCIGLSCGTQDLHCAM